MVAVEVEVRVVVGGGFQTTIILNVHKHLVITVCADKMSSGQKVRYKTEGEQTGGTLLTVIKCRLL